MKPASPFERVTLLLWLALCTAVLVFAFTQRTIHDMPVAAVWLVVFLCAPLGLFAAAASGYGVSLLSQELGIPYEPFLSFIPIWLATVASGYVQWFIFIPCLVRKFMKHLTRRLSRPAKGGRLT